MAPMPTESPPAATFQLELPDGSTARLLLSGTWTVTSCPDVWPRLHERLRTTPHARLDVDASGIVACDSAGIALLQFLRAGGMSPPGNPAPVTVTGLRPDWQAAFDRLSAGDHDAHRAPRPRRGHLATDVGRAAAEAWEDLLDQVRFIGGTLAALAGAVARPRELRPREILRILEKAGANALPIVSLISLLVGLILAFESAQPMRLFGAEIFIADMIGLVMVRELGPLMTAILLAGRSGSAFAAEIGTMKVNEELNALETMGLQPVRFLVVPRLLAALILTPLLTIHSMAMGIAGGVIVLLVLGFPLALIFTQLTGTLDLGDIAVGLTKGVVFGWIVATMGCLRGLQTRQGPSAVGESTTRAVVSGILLLILADALFSIVLYALEE